MVLELLRRDLWIPVLVVMFVAMAAPYPIGSMIAIVWVVLLITVIVARLKKPKVQQSKKPAKSH